MSELSEMMSIQDVAIKTGRHVYNIRYLLKNKRIPSDYYRCGGTNKRRVYFLNPEVVPYIYKLYDGKKRISIPKKRPQPEPISESAAEIPKSSLVSPALRQDMMKLTSMRLGEFIKIGQGTFYCVPGGWLFVAIVKGTGVTSTFIPWPGNRTKEK